MSIPDILLAVCVLILVWRVWRLEYLLEAFDRALMRKGDVDWLQGALNENLSRCVAGSEQRIAFLARALGYEWKRTDAKEGWEKRAPIEGRKIDWVWMDEPPRFVHAPSYWADGKERRKADRRKPDLTHTANAQGSDGKVRKVSSKKPRRAH